MIINNKNGIYELHQDFQNELKDLGFQEIRTFQKNQNCMKLQPVFQCFFLNEIFIGTSEKLLKTRY